MTGQPVKNQPGEIRAPRETNYHKIKIDLCVCATENVCAQYSMFTSFSGSQSTGSVVTHPFQAALAWAVMWAWLDLSFTSLWMELGLLLKGPVSATSCGSGIPWRLLNSQSLCTVGTNNYISSLVSGSMPTQANLIVIYGFFRFKFFFLNSNLNWKNIFPHETFQDGTILKNSCTWTTFFNHEKNISK